MRANRGDRVLRPRRVASAVHGQVGAAVPAVGFRIIRSNVIYNFALFDLHLYNGDAMVTPRVAASSASCRLTKAAVHSTRALAIPRAQRLPPRRRMPMHSPVAAAHPRSASSQRSATRASTSRVAPTALLAPGWGAKHEVRSGNAIRGSHPRNLHPGRVQMRAVTHDTVSRAPSLDHGPTVTTSGPPPNPTAPRFKPFE